MVSYPVFGASVKVGSVSATQFGVNSNVATTGHKLQGMSKDNLVVTDWNYDKNWVYVVLSRVRTLAGLFSSARSLTKPKTTAWTLGCNGRSSA